MAGENRFSAAMADFRAGSDGEEEELFVKDAPVEPEQPPKDKHEVAKDSRAEAMLDLDNAKKQAESILRGTRKLNSYVDIDCLVQYLDAARSAKKLMGELKKDGFYKKQNPANPGDIVPSLAADQAYDKDVEACDAAYTAVKAQKSNIESFVVQSMKSALKVQADVQAGERVTGFKDDKVKTATTNESALGFAIDEIKTTIQAVEELVDLLQEGIFQHDENMRVFAGRLKGIMNDAWAVFGSFGVVKDRERITSVGQAETGDEVAKAKVARLAAEAKTKAEAEEKAKVSGTGGAGGGESDAEAAAEAARLAAEAEAEAKAKEKAKETGGVVSGDGGVDETAEAKAARLAAEAEAAAKAKEALSPAERKAALAKLIKEAIFDLVKAKSPGSATEELKALIEAHDLGDASSECLNLIIDEGRRISVSDFNDVVALTHPDQLSPKAKKNIEGAIALLVNQVLTEALFGSQDAYRTKVAQVNKYVAAKVAAQLANSPAPQLADFDGLTQQDIDNSRLIYEVGRDAPGTLAVPILSDLEHDLVMKQSNADPEQIFKSTLTATERNKITEGNTLFYYLTGLKREVLLDPPSPDFVAALPALIKQLEAVSAKLVARLAEPVLNSSEGDKIERAMAQAVLDILNGSEAGEEGLMTQVKKIKEAPVKPDDKDEGDAKNPKDLKDVEDGEAKSDVEKAREAAEDLLEEADTYDLDYIRQQLLEAGGNFSEMDAKKLADLLKGDRVVFAFETRVGDLKRLLTDASASASELTRGTEALDEAMKKLDALLEKTGIAKSKSEADDSGKEIEDEELARDRMRRDYPLADVTANIARVRESLGDQLTEDQDRDLTALKDFANRLHDDAQPDPSDDDKEDFIVKYADLLRGMHDAGLNPKLPGGNGGGNEGGGEDNTDKPKIFDKIREKLSKFRKETDESIERSRANPKSKAWLKSLAAFLAGGAIGFGSSAAGISPAVIYVAAASIGSAGVLGWLDMKANFSAGRAEYHAEQNHETRSKLFGGLTKLLDFLNSKKHLLIPFGAGLAVGRLVAGIENSTHGGNEPHKVEDPTKAAAPVENSADPVNGNPATDAGPHNGGDGGAAPNLPDNDGGRPSVPDHRFGGDQPDGAYTPDNGAHSLVPEDLKISTYDQQHFWGEAHGHAVDAGITGDQNLDIASDAGKDTLRAFNSHLPEDVIQHPNGHKMIDASYVKTPEELRALQAAHPDAILHPGKIAMEKVAQLASDAHAADAPTGFAKLMQEITGLKQPVRDLLKTPLDTKELEMLIRAIR